MLLTPGITLGPYEILSPLGEGGMGEVYRARDTRLDRIVALKIVRTDFSERFEREARAISALNHPHICSLYDVGSASIQTAQSGTESKIDFLVMELVDGQPVKGPMPVADVLRYGRQIGEALDAAHRSGIVHRDLKPANILLTKAGVKLLDFGLAKARATTASGPRTDDMTVAALTGAHTIVGTPQYMAPEQIEGREADARSDIFAFGCVLYELLTGQRAFEGKTVSNVMAAILATEPRRVSELVPMTPASLEWVVQRCLEKDPDARWQSAADVALQLKWLAEQPAAAGSVAETARRPSLGWLGGLAAGMVLAGLAAGAWVWTRPIPASGVVGSSIAFPDGLQLGQAVDVSAIAISPDGGTTVLSLRDSKGAALYIRPLGDFGLTKIAGSEEVTGGAAFSPDGKWLAFQRKGEVVKLPVGGGVAVPICTVQQLRGLAWLSDDELIVVPLATSGLMRVAPNGGPLQPLTHLNADRREKTHRTPVVLPGGATVLMTVGADDMATYDRARIVAVSLATGAQTDLVDGGYAPAYSPTGHLLYVRDNTLFAVPFDPKTLAVGRTPVRVVDNISAAGVYGIAQYAVSATGTLLFATGGNPASKSDVLWVTRAGAIEPTGLPADFYDDVEYSPDGTRVLVSYVGANQFQSVFDIARRELVPLTRSRDVLDAVWTPDSRRVTYSVGSEVRTISADGGEDTVLIPASVVGERVVVPTSWSPDGKTLVLQARELSASSWDIMTYSVDTQAMAPLVATPFNETTGRVSPDGRWLAYTSDDGGQSRVYVRAMSGSSARYSIGPGGVPMWVSGGRELTYFGRDNLYTVTIEPGDPPRIGTPAPWGPIPKDAPGIGDISMHPDGSRFVFVSFVAPKRSTAVDLVVNWAGGPIAGR